MDYYLCDISKVVEDGISITRPSISDHLADWNTQGSYDARSGTVLVQCQPTTNERTAIDADARCRFLVTTDETFETITKKIAVRKRDISTAEADRVAKLLSKVGFSMTFDNPKADEIKDALSAAIKARQ